jgi:hypothetical protein
LAQTSAAADVAALVSAAAEDEPESLEPQAASTAARAIRSRMGTARNLDMATSDGRVTGIGTAGL